MSAKQKRPFFIFAAVAAVCCMVLVTGVRSKANDSQEPPYYAAPSSTNGSTIKPLPEAPDGSARGPGPVTQRDAGQGTPDGSSGGTHGPATFDSPQANAADADPRDDGGSAPDSGVNDVPQVDLPDLPPVEVDPDLTGPPDDKGGNSAGRNPNAKHEGKRGLKENDGDEAEGEDDVVVPGYGHPTQPLGEDEIPDQQDQDAEEGLEQDLEED